MGQDNYFNHASYDRSGGNLAKACDWCLRVQSYYSGWRSLDTGTVATHTGAVTVTVVDPAGTGNSPYRVDLTLQVVNTSLSTVHLPAILHDYVYP